MLFGLPCFFCDGTKTVIERPPPSPEVQRILDAVETHCREWREWGAMTEEQKIAAKEQAMAFSPEFPTIEKRR